MNDPIIVNSISEEYEHVGMQTCEQCGEGPGVYDVYMQSLVRKNKTHYDVLHCRCKACGRETEFTFDISSFFGKWR